MPFSQSKQFWREPNNPPKIVNLYGTDPTIQPNLLEHIIKNVPQNNLDETIKQIDRYAEKNWMMNLGPEKSKILKSYISFKEIKNVIELGGYCGYSALVFAQILPQAKIHTIQINQEYANIAHKIQKHAGVADRITIHIGTVPTLQETIRKNGPYDLIFIDHLKNLYLQDYLILEKYQVIKKGAIVVGDNIITPGSPDYLEHFKNNANFDSVLEHSYVEYCDIPDAILISQKINQGK